MLPECVLIGLHVGKLAVELGGQSLVLLVDGSRLQNGVLNVLIKPVELLHVVEGELLEGGSQEFVELHDLLVVLVLEPLDLVGQLLEVDLEFVGSLHVFHVEDDGPLLDELEHAYAVTIHKSQGSEYPAVVIPLLGGPKMLMNRNLLYTAVTRAKKCVTIVGDDETFNLMIKNNSQQRRYSGLCDRICELGKE